MNRAIVKAGATAMTAPQPRPHEVIPRPPRLVMRYPTLEESVRGFDLWFAGWSTGQTITLDQAITEASMREVVASKTARQRAEQQARREREMQAHYWETGEDWHVVDDCYPLLESGQQVELRKAAHAEAVGRRLLELQGYRGVGYALSPVSAYRPDSGRECQIRYSSGAPDEFPAVQPALVL